MLQLLAEAAECNASTSWPDALVLIVLIIAGAAAIIAIFK
jgi:hypothetical protein